MLEKVMVFMEMYTLKTIRVQLSLFGHIKTLTFNTWKD